MDGTTGEIRYFAGNFEPRGWAFCAGQISAIQANTSLYSLLGTTYGGNGTTNFAYPDFRGRVAIGAGASAGLTTRNAGQTGGAESISVSVANMPTHTHTAVFTPTGIPGTITASLNASANQATENVPGTNGANAIGLGSVVDTGNQVDPIVIHVNDSNPTVPLVGTSVAATGGTAGTGTVTNAVTGGSQPLANIKPFLALNHIICLQGVYPARP